MMSKKYFYIVLIQIYYLTSAVFAQSTLDTLSFLHISDTHICNLDGYDSSFVNDRQKYGNGFKPIENFLKTVPDKLGVDAIVLTGDMLDFYEAETTNDKLETGQVEYFLPLVEMSKVPMFLILGNHDISSYWVDENQSKIKSQFNTMNARAKWIRGLPLFKDGTYYTRDYRVGGTSYLFVFLDIGFKTDDAIRGYWDEPQLVWLRVQLKNVVNKKIVLFYHLPLPVKDTNQDGIHFKMPPDGWPFADTYDKGILKILNEYPNIIATIVGHGHINVIEDMHFPAGHTITQVQTGALGKDLNNWRLIQFMERKISVTVPGVETIEKNIEWKK